MTTMTITEEKWLDIKNPTNMKIKNKIAKVTNKRLKKIQKEESRRQKAIAKEEKKKSEGREGYLEQSPCKRWLFILSAIFLGAFGIHYLYARRWILFIVQWICIIKIDKDSDIPTALFLLLWLIVPLFIKTDGKKRRFS